VSEAVLREHGYTVTDIRDLLETVDPYAQVGIAAVDAELGAMLSLRGVQWERLTEPQREDYRSRLGVGATHRLIGNARKWYGGLQDFVLLSSGLVRAFVELCALAVCYAEEAGVAVADGQKVGFRHQTEAAHTHSAVRLSMITGDIADLGPAIYQFILDLADIFREKLLRHTSEPEAARLTVRDPHALDTARYAYLREVLTVCEKETVLQARAGVGGMRPRSPALTQPVDLVPNRVYAPSLRCSPRARWSTGLWCAQLQGLLDPMQRDRVKALLIHGVAASDPADQPLLFNAEDSGDVD
jgi:hypothetical protein